MASGSLHLGEMIALGLLEAKGEDSWEYNSIHDDRCCDECDGYDGVVFTDGQIESFFPYAMKTPMLVYPQVHPHCRCAMALVTERVIVTIDLPEPVGFGAQLPPPQPESPIKVDLLSPDDVARVQKAIQMRHYTPLQPAGMGELPRGLGESFLTTKKKKDK